MQLNSSRRQFLENISQCTGGLSLFFLPKSLQNSFLDNVMLPINSDITHLEDFWHVIRQAYSISRGIINLNNGGVSPQPVVVQEAVEHYQKLSNEAPSYYMWRILDKGREPLRSRLASLLGAQENEVAIHRNTTEAIDNVIFGLPLKAGDEVILSKQDYPNMINAWKQRELREGIILKWIDLEMPSEEVDYFVTKYQEKISDRTRLIHLTHVINWNGQIMPAKEIVQMAHRQGIEVLLDAAHSFAQFQFDIKEIGCDYMGTSLHKWLGAPFGTGLLYVRADKISKLYPLMSSPDPLSSDIRKFEHLGTRSFPIEQAISHAIDFHLMIGWDRKYKRLHYLKNYWMDQLEEISGVQIKTSKHPAFGGAIGLFSKDGAEISEIYGYLFNKYGIHTSPSNWNGIEGIRITPNVYTSLEELDRLIAAVQAFQN